MTCEQEWAYFDDSRRKLEYAIITDVVQALLGGYDNSTNRFDAWASGRSWSTLIDHDQFQHLLRMMAALYPLGTADILAFKVGTAMHSRGLLSKTQVICDSPGGINSAQIRFS